MAWRDEEMEAVMGQLLLWGVIVAGSVMVFGGVLYILRHGGETASYQVFHGVPPELKTVSGVIQGAGHLRARAVIQLAVLLMIATPVLRVVFAIFAFAREKDWLYTLISIFVLGLLVYALCVI